MAVVRFDPHAHLYDSYPVKEWCNAAYANLKGSEGACVVIVVDRAGQDSFERLRREVPTFGTWYEAPLQSGDGVSEAGTIEWNQKRLHVIRGVQYVSVERLEVLALGVGRSVPDGAPAAELIDRIRREGGIACLPWSPGKWLGSRGTVVRRIMRGSSPREFVFGDIAIRTALGPCSLVLRRARRARFLVICGTDPLPDPRDATLVGSFGMQINVDTLPSNERLFSDLLAPALVGAIPCGPYGRRNGVARAVRRFISTL